MGLFDFFKKGNNSFKLNKILQMEDATSAIIELDTHISELSNYGADLSKLSHPQKVLLFVEMLEREINNGGFNQFYWNSSGDFSEEILIGLKTIGAHKMAAIMAKANTTWPDQKPPKDRIERQELHEKIEEKADPIWEVCDQEFYEYPDDIAALLFEYVKEHKADFS